MTEESETPPRPSVSYGRDRLVELYIDGMLLDEEPRISPRFEDLREAARESLAPEVFAYVAGSAGAERTAKENRDAFSRYRLVPRMLQDVEERDLSVELFGETYPAPVALAPIGVQGIIHERGEQASAQAAAELGLPFALSTVADETIEDIAEQTETGPLWFQLYWNSDRELTLSLVERAEAAGYEALIVTVDTPVIAWRERDVRTGYLPFLDRMGLANYFSDPIFRERLGGDPSDQPDAAVMQFIDLFGDASLTWDDIGWLVDRTELPVLVKGIVHPEDAENALAVGADGVIVSNHGGRQVDNAVAAIDALPKAIDHLTACGFGDAPVLFDSGMRRGADALIALAIGARMVFLGRPYAYGLAIEGAKGVEGVCRNFLADLDLTLGLTGHTSIAELNRSSFATVPGELEWPGPEPGS